VIRGECLTQEGTTRLELLADDQVIGAVEAPGGASFAGMALIGGSTGEPGARATFTNPTMTAIDEETPAVLDDPLAEQARMRAPHPVLLDDYGTKPGLFAESQTHRREFSYTGGEYRINVLESDSWWWWGHWLDHGSSDVTVAASARSEGSHTSDGRFGVLCIARPSVAYAFVVDPAMQEDPSGRSATTKRPLSVASPRRPSHSARSRITSKAAAGRWAGPPTSRWT